MFKQLAAAHFNGEVIKRFRRLCLRKLEDVINRFTKVVPNYVK